MAVNFKLEYERIASQLTRLFQDEIKKQGLVDSGDLLASVKWTVKETATGWELKMEAMDYFKYLDDRYKISDNVFNSSTYIQIQTQIGELYNLYIIEQLTQ